MRFIPPDRCTVAPTLFARAPLAGWNRDGWLDAAEFPTPATLNRAWPARTGGRWQFVEQTAQLLADRLHYEIRIAERGQIATRAGNWHDLFNALVWLRYPAIKSALNARHAAEIARMRTGERSRAQYALTHFDEAGAIVLCAEDSLLARWDAHDWHGLFWRARDAWNARIAVLVFGHALLELALVPARLLVAKALVLSAPAEMVACFARADQDAIALVEAHAARLIRDARWLGDPQELRPLPLSAIPGWNAASEDESFYRSAECLRPLRAGRVYPSAFALAGPQA